MKLSIEKEFDLEVGEDTYSGMFKDLTKKQDKELNKTLQKRKDKNTALQNLLKKIKKQERKIFVAEKQELWKEISTLEKSLDTLEAQTQKIVSELEDSDVLDTMFKSRLTMSISGEDKQKIMAIGEEYGYERVFSTIIDDIREKQEKK